MLIKECTKTCVLILLGTKYEKRSIVLYWSVLTYRKPIRSVSTLTKKDNWKHTNLAFSSNICPFTVLFESTILKVCFERQEKSCFWTQKKVREKTTDFFDFPSFLSFDIAWNEVTKWVRIQKNHLTMLNSWKSLCICETPKKLFNHCQPGVLKTRNPRIKLQDVGSKWRKRVRYF